MLFYWFAQVCSTRIETLFQLGQQHFNSKYILGMFVFIFIYYFSKMSDTTFPTSIAYRPHSVHHELFASKLNF